MSLMKKPRSWRGYPLMTPSQSKVLSYHHWESHTRLLHYSESLPTINHGVASMEDAIKTLIRVTLFGQEHPWQSVYHSLYCVISG